jgi:hypothetical protein
MPPLVKSSATEVKPIALVSTVFCADDADVVIRAAGALDFRAHKVMLSLVSSFFKTMFTVPQPPSDTPDTLPHVDVNESAETWENILRTIYPMPNPVIADLHDLESLLLAATKYEMQFVIDANKINFEDRGFIQRDPLHLYAIACACGFDDQAKYVARHAERLKVTRRPSVGDLKGLTMQSYHLLVSFLAERDNEWYQTIGRATIPFNPDCRCNNKAHKEALYIKVKDNLKIPHLQKEEIYLRALEDPIRVPQPACAGVKECVLGAVEIKAFIERVTEEMETVSNKLMW